MRTLAHRTDRMVMSDASTFKDHRDYWVQTTPTEPTFWCGNQIILKSSETPFDQACDLFEAHFPFAKHRLFAWDIQDLNPDALDPRFARENAPLECCQTLVHQGPFPMTPLSDGVVFRALSTDEDWQKSLNLQVIIGAEDGFDPTTHRPYLHRRNITRRRLIAAGLGTWIAGFVQDRVVAQMGIFMTGKLARYQDVQTHPAHRRRGLAAGLLRQCHDWAISRAPDAQLVIVTEDNSDAARLYKRLGFKTQERVFSSMKPGY